MVFFFIIQYLCGVVDYLFVLSNWIEKMKKCKTEIVNEKTLQSEPYGLDRVVFFFIIQYLRRFLMLFFFSLFVLQIVKNAKLNQKE